MVSFGYSILFPSALLSLYSASEWAFDPSSAKIEVTSSISSVSLALGGQLIHLSAEEPPKRQCCFLSSISNVPHSI